MDFTEIKTILSDAAQKAGIEQYDVYRSLLAVPC